MSNKFQSGDIINNGKEYYLVVKTPGLFRKNYSIINLNSLCYNLYTYRYSFDIPFASISGFYLVTDILRGSY